MQADDQFYDNTRVSGYESCERKYFFRHEMHLAPEGTAPELVFGLAWHNSSDVIWRYANKFDADKLAKMAYVAWEQRWIDEGMPSHEDITPDVADWLKMRSPTTASLMIPEYIEARLDRIQNEFEVLGIEQPFAVPLDPNDPHLWYCGRLDKVYRDKLRGGIYVVDHKTTSQYLKDGYFRSSWVESFSPDAQMDGYAYAAKMMYGEEFKGIIVDGALVHKTVHEGFCWIPVSRGVDKLDEWLWRTLRRVKEIRRDKKRLRDVAPQDEYLNCFPKKTGNCFSYNKPCAYIDFCKGVANPVAELEEYGVPAGFEIDEWKPFEVNHLRELTDGST